MCLPQSDSFNLCHCNTLFTKLNLCSHTQPPSTVLGISLPLVSLQRRVHLPLDWQTSQMILSWNRRAPLCCVVLEKHHRRCSQEASRKFSGHPHFHCCPSLLLNPGAVHVSVVHRAGDRSVLCKLRRLEMDFILRESLLTWSICGLVNVCCSISTFCCLYWYFSISATMGSLGVWGFFSNCLASLRKSSISSPPFSANNAAQFSINLLPLLSPISYQNSISAIMKV